MLSLIAIRVQMSRLLEVLVGIYLDSSVLYFGILFRPSASYFSLLAQRISNQKKGHPSFRLFP
ncbi:hypothetical protein, partial [Methylophilus sp.]|uniref:hypothetical protein n=1 Tax=Methylophilus sp. TaxID=29541 RepID=UPI0040377D1E